MTGTVRSGAVLPAQPGQVERQGSLTLPSSKEPVY